MRIDNGSNAILDQALQNLDQSGPLGLDIGHLMRRLAEALRRNGDGIDTSAATPPFAAEPPPAGAATGGGAILGPAPAPVLTAQERILGCARELFASPDVRASFARAARYSSLNPEITGSYGGQPKCNVFAGDVLHKAGFALPTYTVKGWDGAEGKHYMNAERWPKQTDHFDKITDLAQAQPGDVIVADHLGRTGAGGAHLEVITSVGADAKGRPEITTMGARTNGLTEDEKHGRKLTSARQKDDHFILDLPERPGQSSTSDTAFYVLRPKKPLDA